MTRAAGALAATVTLAVAGCGGDDSRDPPLVVSAATSLRIALEACADDGIRLSFAGSDELAAQIRNGVRPDVYAAANTRLPEELAREGLLEQPVAFATNRLVLAVPGGSEIDGLDDVESGGVRVVVGAPSVPIGEYTRGVLGKLGPERERAILANVRSEEPDVAGIVGKLRQGAADAGFVYRTDVEAAGEELKALPIPDELGPEARYGAGVVEGARRPVQARQFVEGLREGPCADELRKAGFGRP